MFKIDFKEVGSDSWATLATTPVDTHVEAMMVAAVKVRSFLGNAQAILSRAAEGRYDVKVGGDHRGTIFIERLWEQAVMCKAEPRYWFSACSRGSGRMVHIISARSIGKARASLGRLSEEYLFEQMMWGDIVCLLGVAPPTPEQETTFAEGHLLFEYQGKVISLEVAD